jgi:acetyl esterase/lipase
MTASDNISIAYLINQQKGVSPKESLIFHCHGGGYVSSTYRSHEVYLREWGKRLRVPIVCVSYRLCPEQPYPASLQDLLDAYLFLTSGSSEALAKIGFIPRNIIVTGDSAGGNMALALVLALNEIRKSDAPAVCMPVAIALQYPNGNPAVDSSCSRAMSLIDTTITVSGLGHAAASYFGADHSGNELWFRSAAYEGIARAMMHKMKTDPLYNPLISTHFADLKHIKLFILAAEFDPLLDDAVAIGRVWQGPLVMDLARGLPHSFMSYAAVPDVSDAMDVAISRITEGLGL